ncbi:queuine tRNA-ribosyltransferase accessory subunit 2 [Daktulosphaira vitifoliae]|uniref:queuine tRNA-ribosyltransferase accessory subunit 2 n=1 Tax=Daktulosphaira vitifoliae TaxID=58002 RepID=UPI0021AB05F3|nr:queuine tRNA-ribosyltransferase accessory subunit 2 [Daktulosphaira vitifoliae]
MDHIHFTITQQCSNSKGGRLGTIKNLTKQNSQIDTPGLMFYTKSGSVPHISREVFQMIIPDDQVLFNFPLPTHYGFFKPIEKLNKSLVSFVGLKGYSSFCSIRDYTTNNITGYNKKDQVAIKTKAGNQLINYEKYMHFMEAFKPSLYVTLCVSETDMNSSPSSIEKSVNLTNRIFEQSLKYHNESKILQKSGIIAPIQGGYSISERIRSAEFLSQFDVFGYLLDGFANDGSSIEFITKDMLQPIIDKTLEQLPNEKIKIICGAWSPSVVIDLINSGIDLFDTSLPYLLAERGSALVFDYKLVYKDNLISMNILNNNDKMNQDHIDKTYYEMNLRNERHFESLIPIKDTCICLACKKHTRSYIHHLLQSKEMLGSLLLTIHNLHYYYQFFNDIREVLKKSQNYVTVCPIN